MIRINWMICLCFVAICLATTADSAIAVQGGTHGQDGDPGGDGTDGGAGVDERHNAFGLRALTAWATKGINGGNGGAGIDGDDEDETAAGGNGGNGGTGGRVLIGQSRADEFARSIRISGRAGSGGDGGLFGVGTSPVLNGLGGDGGDGGSAYIGIQQGHFMNIDATGGNGGIGYGVGSSGGNGGFAIGEANYMLPFDPVTGQLLLNQTGGSGGYGDLGAKGGNGATVLYGLRPEQFSLSSPDSAVLRTNFRGQGGYAGGTTDGTAGLAGHAIISVDQLFKSVVHVEPGSSDMFFQMVGGNGGDGHASSQNNVAGSNGGNARGISTGNSTRLNNTNSLVFGFNVVGGNGGNATGGFNSGDGGNGGFAHLDALSFDLSRNQDGSLASTFVSGAVSLTGGSGGNAVGSGQAGNGASANYYNQLTVDASSKTSLWINAHGGHGGLGQQFNGNGGHAIVAMDNGINFSDSGESQEEIVVRATSRGGNAGLGNTAINEASGGNAYSSVMQTNVGMIFIESEASGGWGHLGRSGTSTARAYGTSTNSRATATARAEIQRANLLPLQPLPTIGVNSIADARATSLSNVDPNYDSATSVAIAYGSFGTVTSGNALAFAQSTHTGQKGLAFASSNSTAFGDRNSSSDNQSLSIAKSKSASWSATSDAAAFSVGHDIKTQARATIESVFGSVKTAATSQTFARRHRSNISNQAWLSFGSVTQGLDAVSSSTFARSRFDVATGYEIRSDVVVAPESNFADAIASATTYKNVFVDDNRADILGVGRIGAEHTDANANGKLTVHSELDLSMQVLDYQNDLNFLLGFTTNSIGDGFSTLNFIARSNGGMFIDESFDSLPAAELFFDNRLFDMGPLADLTSDLSLNFKLDMTFDNVGDGFHLGFVFGNAMNELNGDTFSAVPEPSSLIFAFGFTGLFWRRRRRV